MPDFLSATRSDEMVVGEPRRCKLCNGIKPLAEFTKWRPTWCKVCAKAKWREYNARRGEKYVPSDVEHVAFPDHPIICPCGAQVFPEKFERAEIIRCCQCRAERVAAVYPQALLPQG